MTYKQAITFLDSRIGVGWKLGLDSIKCLLTEFDNPHTKIKCVHIAGTNGKGSTCAMLESIFRAAGYRTGMYTSPHLIDVSERIQINRENISPEHFAALMSRIAPIIEEYGATYFETLTLLAFLYFAESNLDIAFIEVGLGGRLDATNVIRPELSIITSIDFDHTQHLGDTLEKIATEKAGIVKSGVPCLVGDLQENVNKVIVEICEKQNSAFFQAAHIYRLSALEETPTGIQFSAEKGKFAGDMNLAVAGRCQLLNAGMAMAASELLEQSGFSIAGRHIRDGLSTLSWPGRFEIVSRHPIVILDVAHNPASIAHLVELLSSIYKNKKLCFIIGLMQDKDVDLIVSKISEIAFVVQPVAVDYPRALAAQELHKKFERFDVSLYKGRSVRDGVMNVLQHCEDDAVVCITGSHYIAGEALEAIKGLTK